MAALMLLVAASRPVSFMSPICVFDHLGLRHAWEVESTASTSVADVTPPKDADGKAEKVLEDGDLLANPYLRALEGGVTTCAWRRLVRMRSLFMTDFFHAGHGGCAISGRFRGNAGEGVDVSAPYRLALNLISSAGRRDWACSSSDG